MSQDWWCVQYEKLPYDSNVCLVYAGISSVDNWAFNKNLSHIVLIGCDFHSLVLSDNLNRCGADWMHLMQSLNLLSCPDIMWSQSVVCSNFSESTIILTWCESDILHHLDMIRIWYSALSSYDVNLIYCIVFILIWADREDNRTLDQSDR
jgi:hypothetical protein